MKKNDIRIITQTCKNLFLNIFLYIPKYQRGYSWEKDNVLKYIEDLLDNENYYVGNIMLAKKSDNEYEVIDGQQRLITSFLILCAIKNHLINIDNFNNEMLFRDKRYVINIEDRVGDGLSKLFDYLYKNITVTEDIKSMNENKMYELIKKTISSYDKLKLELLYQNVCFSNLVSIIGTENASTPYQVFLNINTKGVRLTCMEIIKSKIFYYLAEEKDFNTHRNNWFLMEKEIGNNNHDNFLEFFLMFYEAKINKQDGKKIRIVKQSTKNLSKNILNLIKNKENALNIFNYLCNKDKGILLIYNAIVNNKYDEYIEKFSDTSVNFTNVFNLIKYMNKNRFVQFNIAFISLFYFENNNDKKKIKDNFNYIYNFIQLVFLYCSLNSLLNKSPSTYANRFIELAINNYLDKSSIKSNINSLINTFSIKSLNKNSNEILKIEQIECKDSTKELRIANSLISFLDDDTVCDYNAEHFICQKSTSLDRYKLGNIIPVTIDPYKDMSQDDKIIKYRDDATSQPHIKKFLELYEKKGFSIDTRTKHYQDLLITKYNELCEKFV